jgi:hypothetical protein
MSNDIQETAKPFLIPLFEGAPALLSEEAQRLVSAWIGLATIIAEFGEAKDLFRGKNVSDSSRIRHCRQIHGKFGLELIPGPQRGGSIGTLLFRSHPLNMSRQEATQTSPGPTRKPRRS